MIKPAPRKTPANPQYCFILPVKKDPTPASIAASPKFKKYTCCFANSFFREFHGSKQAGEGLTSAN
jgi:hypothetical protein